VRREFFLQDDVSNKFWTVELNESTVRTTLSSNQVDCCDESMT